MGFGRFADIAEEKIHLSTWRKTTATVATTSQWYDDTMLAGVPPANFYASEPLVAATLDGRRGIRHWTSGYEGTEHLLSVVAWGNSGTLEAPAQFVMCDWLMYYPFIDGDSIEPQDLDTSISLPRYSPGHGVEAFMVAQGPGSAAATYTISYTNSDGEAGRTATGRAIVPTAAGYVITSGGGGSEVTRIGPFIGRQGTDRGIQSIQQITWTSPPGGIMAIVLVRPLAQFLYAEIGTPAETNFYPTFPRVLDGAYLGLLRHQTGATPAARVFGGMLSTLRS